MRNFLNDAKIGHGIAKGGKGCIMRTDEKRGERMDIQWNADLINRCTPTCGRGREYLCCGHEQHVQA